MKKWLVFILLPMMALAALPNGDRPQYTDENVVEIISQNNNLQTLTKLLQAADLDGILEGPGPFTFFAPNDQAFNKLGEEKLKELMHPENKKQLRSILFYHIVPGRVLSGQLENMKLPTANGESIEIQVSGSKVTINGAEVVGADREGENGVIHVINDVLLPPETKE